jgi:hypothetical protein
MKRNIFNLLFISIISVCLVVGFLGRIAIAAEDEPSRGSRAYEQERTCIGGYCFYTGRQYTSQYDLLRGEIYPEITFQYAAPDYGRMFNPFAPTYESSYEASAIGGLFSGPMMRLPVSGMSYLLGTIGAPQAQTYQSMGPFTGSTSYTSLYPGFGFQGSGFMLGPFRNIWGGGGYSGYSGAAGWGSPFSGFGFGGLFGYPGISGGSTGNPPTRIY